MGNGKKKKNEPFPGLEPSIKTPTGLTTITVEEGIVQQFQIPPADTIPDDISALSPTTAGSGICQGCSNPLDNCQCDGTPTGFCQCACGCNYKLQDYAADEVFCGACEDNCDPHGNAGMEVVNDTASTVTFTTDGTPSTVTTETAPPPTPPTVAEPAEGEDIAGQSLNGTQALDFQAAHADDVLTPLPSPGDLTVGDGLGTHLVLGGDDYENSQVTLIAYQDAHDPNAQRQILFTHITPEAEEKIRAALALKATLVEQEVTETVTGPLEIDQNHEISSNMELAARSVNQHLKDGDGLPEHTIERINKLTSQFTALGEDADEKTAAMLEHYRPSLEAMQKIHADFNAAKAQYDADGTRVPKVSAFTTTHEVTKTVKVPGPATAGLPITEVPNRVVHPTLDNGVTSWDGQIKGAAGHGSMLRVDLGDGYTAYYRPREGIPGEYGEADHRNAGELEIVAPAGTDDPTTLVSKLGNLNLANDPLTHKEAEWAYLRANIFAANLEKNATVKKAMAACNNDIEAQVGILTAQHYHEAIGLDEKELSQWANRITVRAQRRSLAKRTERIRAAVAKATGTTSEDLLGSGNYQPTPVISRIGVTWRRFDVDAQGVASTWQQHKRGMSHRLVTNPQNILNMLQTGTLSAQRQRRRLGVPAGVGWSESSDKTFNAVYLRNWTAGKVEGNSAGFAWSDPSTLLQRPDWWANNGDKYGSESSHRDPLSAVSVTSGGNEFMFKGGIDLYGPEAPTSVNVPSSLMDKAKAIVASKGITEVNGIPVDKWLRAV